jgi:acyl-CoA synthetase (AMP-forming)/AMP-acid ligase II
MGLLDYFLTNENLVFLDARSSEPYPLEALLHKVPQRGAEEAGKLVFLYLDDSLLAVSVYLSYLNSPHTLALLNAGLAVDMKQALEDKYRPNLITDVVRKEIEGYEGQVVSLPFGSYSSFYQDTESIPLHSNCKVLLSTSGSTGSPKFVKLSEENLIQNALSITGYLPIRHDDVTPLNLPVYYSYGLSVLHSNAIKGGMIVCGVSDIIQREFWAECEAFGFTSIAGVPFIYEMLDRIGFRKKKYPSLRYLTQAGGNLNIKTKERFSEYCLEHNIALYIMYGQTEATARISYVPPDRLAEKIGSIGIAIPNGTLSLDEANSELLYSGPNVFGGYSTEAGDLEHWESIDPLRTGDLARKDPEGFYYFTGRMKRFVKLYGNRLNLDELEAYLKNTFGNNSLATNGIEDKVILISYSDGLLDENGVKKNIFEHFKIHPTSIKFHQVDEIPLTSNGKVNYKMLLETYGI